MGLVECLDHGNSIASAFEAKMPLEGRGTYCALEKSASGSGHQEMNIQVISLHIVES